MSEIRALQWPDGTPLRPGEAQSFGFATASPSKVMEAGGTSNRNAWLGRPPDSMILLNLQAQRYGGQWFVEATVLLRAPGTAGTLTVRDPKSRESQVVRTHDQSDFDDVFGAGPFQWRMPFVHDEDDR